MPKERNFFRSDKIMPVVYHKQAADYFQRHSAQLGRGIAKKTGHPVFTQWHAYCHAPVLAHPDFKIKILLANANGSAFSELTVPEFDEWYRDLGDWRLKFDKEINLGINQSLELKRRHHVHTTIGSILGDTDLPSTAIEAAIEEKFSEIEPHNAPVKSSESKIDNDFISKTLSELFVKLSKCNSSQEEDFIIKQMIYLMPSEEHAKLLLSHIRSGEYPYNLYDQTPNEDPDDPDLEEIVNSEIPLDIDLNLLYNNQLSNYLESNKSEDEES